MKQELKAELDGQSAPAVPAVAAGGSADYAAALIAYEGGSYGRTLELLSRSAAAGHPRAQEMLAMMYLHGPRLYGAEVPQDCAEARHWFVCAAQSGSDTAALMARLLMRTGLGARPS